jgi:hypothetical protein
VLLDIICDVFFKGSKKEGIIFRQWFDPMPLPLIALIFAAVRRGPPLLTLSLTCSSDLLLSFGARRRGPSAYRVH